ncbi:hypothetical protein, partial [uncultured Duncaniella sp.]
GEMGRKKWGLGLVMAKLIWMGGGFGAIMQTGDVFFYYFCKKYHPKGAYFLLIIFQWTLSHY